MTIQPHRGIITAADRTTLLDGPLGAFELLSHSATSGQLGVVVHTLAPRALGSSVHTHRDEDEYSFVLDGTIGVQIGETTADAGPGDFICKPRGVPHAFWNPTDEPARFLEIISPGGFTEYFRELQTIFTETGPDPEALGALAHRYHLSLDPSSIGTLAQKHGLRLPS
jgi:quercetin dioxygenase-like cupin family protein